MKGYNLYIGVVLIGLTLSGCATSAAIPVSGNGSCHPSADLPAHKALKKVPEVPTLMEDLWALLAGERKDHGADVRDYNSLYDQCVDKKS